MVRPTCSRSLCLPPARTHFWEEQARDVVALLAAQEDVLELVHPALEKSSVGSLRRDERGRAHDAMAAGFKELQNRFSYFA